MRNAERRNGIRYPESLESPVRGNPHAGFGRGTLEKGRKAPRQRPTSPLWDEDFGPGFIKICAYFPYPIKIWLNGHHWTQRQAAKAGIGVTPLAAGSNSFASTTDPAGLQAICDRLGPGPITVFAERWWARLPLPLTPADSKAGYWWDLSMRQVEVYRKLVFDPTPNGRLFFDALVTDNLDVGRPDQIELIFGRRVLPSTTGVFATRVVTRGVDVTVNAFYRHSRVKQYFKRGERSGSRPSSTTPGTWAAAGGWSTSTSCKPRPVTSTTGCCTMNGSVRVVSLRVQPLSGSRAPPSRRDGGPQPYGSATPGSWPWPARWPPPVWSSAGFPTRPCGRSSPDCSDPTPPPTPRAAAATTFAGSSSRVSSSRSSTPTPTSSSRAGNASRSSTPRCTTACSARCWPQTAHLLRCPSGKPCAPSTGLSPTTCPRRA